MNYIRIGEATLCLFLILALWQIDPKNELKSNFLKLFYACLFVILSTFIIYTDRFFDSGNPWIKLALYNLFAFSTLTLIPSLYLYLKSQIQDLKKKDKIAFLYYPSILSFSSSLLLFFGNISDAVLYFLIILLIVSAISSLTWILLHAGRILKNYDASIENKFSNKDDLSLNWIKSLLHLLLLSGFLLFISEILFEFIYILKVLLFGFILFYFGSKSIFYFSYLKSFGKEEELMIEDIQLEEIPMLESKFEEWTKEILNKKLYLDQELTLGKVSQKLGIGSKTLSKEINRNGTTFYNLINTMRIEAASEILIQENSKELVIENIAYDVGFKTKSTFYKHFKSINGCNPKEFRVTSN